MNRAKRLNSKYVDATKRLLEYMNNNGEITMKDTLKVTGLRHSQICSFITNLTYLYPIYEYTDSCKNVILGLSVC